MLLLLAAPAQPALPSAPPPPTVPTAAPATAVFAGRAGQLDVRTQRVSDGQITLDGEASEALWQGAALLTQFTSYNPVDGRAADDSTEVRIIYTPEAMYVGVRAWAPPGTVRATLAERDRISNDDWVAIHLDTFNDRRRAFVFAVNALGVQADGMRSEQSAGPGVSRASLQAADLSQDFLWQSAGRRADVGFEVELRIPFKSIRFQMGRSQDGDCRLFARRSAPAIRTRGRRRRARSRASRRRRGTCAVWVASSAVSCSM